MHCLVHWYMYVPIRLIVPLYRGVFKTRDKSIEGATNIFRVIAIFYTRIKYHGFTNVQIQERY